MTDEQIEKLFDKRYPDAIELNNCGIDIELRKTLFKAAARAVRDEMRGPDRRYDLHDKIIECDELKAELERVKEQNDIGHRHVHELNDRVTAAEVELERVKGERDDLLSRHIDHCDHCSIVSSAWATDLSRLNESLEWGEKLAGELKIASNQLEGVALAIEKHGQNINVQFFIETYTDFSADKELALQAYQAWRKADRSGE